MLAETPEPVLCPLLLLRPSHLTAFLAKPSWVVVGTSMAATFGGVSGRALLPPKPKMAWGRTATARLARTGRGRRDILLASMAAAVGFGCEDQQELVLCTSLKSADPPTRSICSAQA